MRDSQFSLWEALEAEGIHSAKLLPFIGHRGEERFMITFKGDDSMCTWDYLMRALDNMRSREDSLARSGGQKARGAVNLPPKSPKPRVLERSIYERLLGHSGSKKDDRSDAIWASVNVLNGVAEKKWGSRAWRDILLGLTTSGPNWSTFLPHSEEWITGPIHWLQEVGAIDVNPIDVNKWKDEFWNSVPTIDWQGKMMAYHKGGLLIAPTKKCMYRLCVLAQATLFKYTDASRKDFKDFDVNEIIARWDDWIDHRGILLSHPDDDMQMVFIGAGYRDQFDGKEYTSKELGKKVEVFKHDRQSGQDVRDGQIDVNLYESHYILTRNIVDRPGLGPDEGNCVALGRTWKSKTMATSKEPPQQQEGAGEEDGSQAKVSPSLGTENLYSELFQWVEHRDAQKKKILPQKCWRTVRKVTDEARTVEAFEVIPVGPKRFVPYNPFATVLMFWRTLDRLLRDESDNFVLDDKNTELKDTFELAGFFLRLVSITNLEWLWTVSESAPACYKETLPDIPSNCSTQKRRLHHSETLNKAIMERFGQVIDLKTLASYEGSSVTNSRKRDREDEENGGCNNSNKQLRIEHPTASVPGQEDEGEYGQRNHSELTISIREESSTIERIPSSICMTPLAESALSHIKNTLTTVEALRDELGEMALDEQVSYEWYTRELGSFAALEMLRWCLPGPEQKEIVRLWSEIKLLQTQGIDCGGQCYEEVRCKFPKKADGFAYHKYCGSTVDSMGSSFEEENPDNTLLDHSNGRAMIAAELARYSLREEMRTVTQYFEDVKSETIMRLMVLDGGVTEKELMMQEMARMMKQERRQRQRERNWDMNYYDVPTRPAFSFGQALVTDENHSLKTEEMPQVAKWSGEVWAREPPKEREVVWQWKE